MANNPPITLISDAGIKTQFERFSYKRTYEQKIVNIKNPLMYIKALVNPKTYLCKKSCDEIG